MRFKVRFGPMAAGVCVAALVTASCGKQEAPEDLAPTGATKPVAATTAPDRGKVLFVRCVSCHAITSGAPAKIGPNLAGVVGRKGGTLADYKYSPAMQQLQPVWTEEELDRWLASPAKVVPGTSMPFAGIADPADRKALISYLKSPH